MNTRYDTLLAALALGVCGLISGAAPSTAEASFDCGSGWTAYGGGGGVHCMRFLPASGSNAARYVWYAEGLHGTSKYRNIGVAAQSGTTNNFVGSMADISGNGESYSSFRDGNVTLTRSSSTSLPTTFTWNGETWTNASSSILASYTSALKPVIECGAGWQVHSAGAKRRQYKIFRNADSTTSSKVGVRCALGLTASATDVWYGEGEIRSRASEGTATSPGMWSLPSVYAHIGARQGTSYGQWDIKQHGNYNNARGLGTISVTYALLPDTGSGYIVNASDIAAELWIPSRRRHSLRIRPYLTSDSAGTPSLTTEMTAAEVATYVAWANNVFGGSNIEFLYNRSVPAGTGGQLSTVYNTSINDGNLDDGTPGGLQAQFRAERFPADISVYFVHGSTPNVETVGGASSTTCAFVKSSPLGPQGCPGNAEDVIHLAHELGHYLGLPHTFTGNPTTKKLFQSTSEAQKFYNAMSCSGKIFDGDGLDTSFDPFIEGTECASSVSTLSLYCAATATWTVFDLPKDNLMTYYWSPDWPYDKTLTTGQMGAMEGTLKHNDMRLRLE